MNTMDHNLLHHPIKFSIKTNDLEKLKKKPDKLFFKTEVVESDVLAMTVKENFSKSNSSNESNIINDDILKGRPLICDNVIIDKIKKPPKRIHQPEVEQEPIKHRKIEEKDQVIIESETSSALVIRGLPNSVAPPIASKEQTILQIFSKCKDVMTNKLEEKMDLIDRLCKSSSVTQNLFDEEKQRKDLKFIPIMKIKNENSDKVNEKKENTNKDQKIDLKVDKYKKDVHNDKYSKTVEKLDMKIDNKKIKQIISSSKTKEKVQSNADGKSIKAEKLESIKHSTKEKIVDSMISESRRSSHQRLSPSRSHRSSKRFSPTKSSRQNESRKVENRHKSRTKSKERNRDSKSPRKSRRNESHVDESKNRKTVQSLQMGPLSLRDEFMLETERSVLNPEEQLEESFNCKTPKVAIKDKRSIAERLQRLFNKTKITEEMENQRVLQETKEETKVDSQLTTLSTFQPEDKVITGSSLIAGDRVSFSLPSCTRMSNTRSVFTESIPILSLKDSPNQLSCEKVSFLMPLTKGLKTKPITTETNICFPSKSVSKPLPEAKTINAIPECNKLKSQESNFPKCLSKDFLAKDIFVQEESILKEPSSEILSLNKTQSKILPKQSDSTISSRSSEMESKSCQKPYNQDETVKLRNVENAITRSSENDILGDTKNNSWAQDSSSRIIEEEIMTDESSNNDAHQLARGKVSFMISPRKVLKTESIITKIQKSKINTISSIQSEKVETSKSDSKLIENLSIKTSKDSSIKEETSIVSDMKTTEEIHGKKVLSSDDNSLCNDLNIFSINQDQTDKSGSENSNRMHIEKIIIMEPQRKTCNISFRFKTIDKRKCNLKEIVSKTQHDSVEVKALDEKEDYLNQKNSFIELIQNKPIKEKDSSMKLPFILDNFLTLSKMKEEQAFKKELKKEETELNLITKSQKISKIKEELDENPEKLPEKSEQLILKPSLDSRYQDISEQYTNSSRMSQGTIGESAIEDNDINKMMVISEIEDLKTKNLNLSIDHEITDDMSHTKTINVEVKSDKVFKESLNTKTIIENDQKIVTQSISSVIQVDSLNETVNKPKNDPHDSKCIKDNKRDQTTSKFPVDQVKSTRIYRRSNYRNKSGNESRSASRDIKNPTRNEYRDSPDRKYSNNSDNWNSRNRSRDRQRSYRSRSKYSMKRRSISRRKSTNRKRRRRRSSNSSTRNVESRSRNRRYRDDSFRNTREKHYDNRFISDRRSPTSRNKYSDRRKIPRSRSKSRKKSSKPRKSTSRFRYSSDSSKKSSHSKSRKHQEEKDDAKAKAIDKIRKDSHCNEIPNERKSQKLQDVSSERDHKSKSDEKDKVKDNSKSVDNSQLTSTQKNDQKVNCVVKDNVDELVGEKTLHSLSDQSELNVDDNPMISDRDTKSNEVIFKIVENQSTDTRDSSVVTGKTNIITETVKSTNDVQIVIKEKSCAEKCMLNLFNRHIAKTTDVKVAVTENLKTFQTEVIPNQLRNQNYYQPPQSSNISSNNDYFISSQSFHQNQTSMYPTYCDPHLVHNNYPSTAVYQPSTYSNYYHSQLPSHDYESQSYDNYTQNYSNNSVSPNSYASPIFNNNATSTQSMQQWNTEYNQPTYETSPPPPPPTPQTFKPIDLGELTHPNEENCNQARNSSTSSLSNSLMDMDIASASHKSMDSNVGLKLDDNVSNNDDLSSCGDFEYEDIEPQDPFQKYADAPKPKYEHIIKTEVHASAVGMRFEYAYLKSTSCNCVPPNPDEIRLGKAACDENCFNRKIKVECNRNCPVYELCTNRRFQEQIYAPIEPFYSGADKGWGIRSMSNIPSGTFVIEYVGELIDFNEFLKRINETVTYNHHFLMVIQKDMYLDAGNKGNWARFVNHSCDPNTIIERWVVNGKTRIGFFSKKPISKDEEITIDYQFQQYGSVEQKCFCASVNCTGIMGKVNEKLQEQIKMSAIRQRNELIQRIIARKSLREINHVSEMITVIKDNTLDRDTFVNFLEVLLNTGSHLCVRTFIECGGLNILTTYLDTVAWNDWPLKLLYLQCLDHFKLRKRTLVDSGYTSAIVVDFWSDNPRYETKHIVDDSLNIDSYNDDTDTVSDSLEPTPITTECPIQFSLPSSDDEVSDIEKQIQCLALKIKEYFCQEKEKFFIPKIKSNQIEFSNEFSANDSESKSISIASSIQGDYVQLKTRKLRNKCSEVIQKLPKDEFRRLFSERYNKSIEEKNQALAIPETNDNVKNEDIYERIKQLLSNVITEEINNLKQNEQFSTMPLEFQNTDIDKILSSLNIIEKESILPLINLQPDDKSGSLSNYSKSSDETPKTDPDQYLSSTDQLPPNWRFCHSDSGRIYFYHTISKKTQWETPIYPWDAGDDDPSSYDFGDSHNYQVTVDDVKDMLLRYKMNYKEEKLLERQRRRTERTLQRRLSLSEGERNKIQFSREVFKAVKVVMKPYFSSSCKVGRVKTKPDLKFLCEKFADTIIAKEVKLVANLEDLELNSDVSSKISSYIGKFMLNQGRYYKRSKKLKQKPGVTGDSITDSVGGSSTPNF